jgi:signal peptidase I
MIYSVAVGVLLAGLVAAAWTLRRRISVVTVSGLSMLPTYLAGDRVLVRRASIDRLWVGQIVVFEQPDMSGGWTAPPRSPGASSGWMIKRVTALPGDTWPAISSPLQPLSGAPDRPRVPAGTLVVTGDNNAVSYDSRNFGYVPADRLLGVVVRQLGRGRQSRRRRSVWRSKPSSAA